jgi:hypothetical protein
MVKRVVLLFPLILLALLCLTGCDILVGLFSLSPFPGYLAQAVASVDMSDEIETYVGGGDKEWFSSVHVLRNVAGSEYVFLIIRKDYGGQRVYAFDTNLELISYDSIDDHYPLALVDANENFTVGNVEFDYSDMTTTTPYFPNVSVNWEDRAFSRISTNRNYILQNYGDRIKCYEWNMDWTTLVSEPETTLGSTYDMWFRGIGYDPDITDDLIGDNPVYLLYVGHDSGVDEEFLQIVRTPVSDYPSLTSPVFSSYTVSSRVYNVRSSGLCYYTRKGVVAETHNRGRYMLITLDGDLIKRFWVTREEEPALDFDIDGDFYYIFDEADMRLYKAATGF